MCSCVFKLKIQAYIPNPCMSLCIKKLLGCCGWKERMKTQRHHTSDPGVHMRPPCTHSSQGRGETFASLSVRDCLHQPWIPQREGRPPWQKPPPQNGGSGPRASGGFEQRHEEGRCTRALGVLIHLHLALFPWHSRPHAEACGEGFHPNTGQI